MIKVPIIAVSVGVGEVRREDLFCVVILCGSGKKFLNGRSHFVSLLYNTGQWCKQIWLYVIETKLQTYL